MNAGNDSYRSTANITDKARSRALLLQALSLRAVLCRASLNSH